MAVRRGKSPAKGRSSRFWRKGLTRFGNRRTSSRLLQRVESKKPARQLSLSASSSFSIPAATYRLQFNAKFNFKDALDVVDYLRDLGISDRYASPVFAARSQSTHGYDVCNFHKMNPELGNANQFQEFARSLQHAEM